MEPKLGMQVKLQQKLILTPQLHQAIKLLQMTQLELSDSINQELMENPFLEEEEVQFDNDPSEAGASLTQKDKEKPSEPDYEIAKDWEVSDNFDYLLGNTIEDYFTERSSDGRDLGYFTPGTEEQSFLDQPSNLKADLYEHLLWQLRLAKAPEIVRLVGEIIIGNLEEDGYLRTPLEELATTSGVDLHIAQNALRLIQGFDPKGVGAQDVQECLLLQLQDLPQRYKLAEAIIETGFELFKKNKLNDLAELLNVDEQAIREAVQIISRLDTRPGRNYSNDTAGYIIPDVYIVESEDGFAIVLNDESLPRIKLSKQYKNLLANKNNFSDEEKQFLDEKFKSAAWFIKTLDHRNKTIYRVTESILKFQHDFFKRGVKALKPLNLKDVAEELSLHESTVSRVTSTKYLQCQHGILGFKYFFSNAIATSGGDLSTASVKNMLAQIVNEENPADPLSDSKIAEILERKNIKIARRTVAKYREELKIPPVKERKIRKN
jgi:RNA polymerase sigma-54 factor